MLSILVSSKVHFPLKSFITRVAGKRFITGVFSHVSYEVAALAEGFVTDYAFMRLFS